MSKTICRTLVSCAVLITGAQVLAAADLSDQAVVRAAYAKLVLEFRADALRDYAYRAGSGDPETPPKFTLSDWAAGPLSEIASTPVERWTTKPSGYVLEVAPTDWSVQHETGRTPVAHIAKAVWKLAPHMSADWSVPMSTLIEYMGSDYSRYVAYDVTLDYQGRQRSYRALFFFGRDASGASKVFALDHIVGTSGLNHVIADDITLDPLLLPTYSRYRAVTDFLDSVRAAPGCKVDSITRMCCDEKGEICGITGQTVPPRGGLFRFSTQVNAAAASAAPRLSSGDPCSTYDY